MPTLDDARDRDASDPIAWLRDAFVIADDGLLYADGNSLGRLSHATRDAIARAVAVEWGEGLVRSWPAWIDLPMAVGNTIGTHFLGAAPGQTLVSDSTTVNFYKLAASALGRCVDPQPHVVTDATNFPTDRFVLEGLVGQDRMILVDGPIGPSAVDDALATCSSAVPIVTFSHVDYRTGALLDVAGITDVAHRHGALALWDFSHAVGAVEIELDRWDVDLAVGCTYKYLNGGPGSPAFLYVAERLHEVLAPAIQGWFGAADQFAMRPAYEPAPGVQRHLAGTPPIVALRGLEASLGVLADAGVEALAAKGRALTDFVIAAADEQLAPIGFEVVTPRDAGARGAHVALRHEDAWQVCQAMATAGVIPDFREPDVIRLGFAPAYTRYVDAFAAVARVAELVRRGDHRTMPRERARVT